MSFTHIHPLPTSPLTPPRPTPPPYLAPLCPFKNNTMTSICAANIFPGCRLIHWRMVILQGAALLEKTNAPSSRSHQLSIAPHLGVKACENLTFIFWNVDCPDLEQTTIAPLTIANFRKKLLWPKFRAALICGVPCWHSCAELKGDVLRAHWL